MASTWAAATCPTNRGPRHLKASWKSRGLAARYGYHSLWTGAAYLNNDFHATLLLARVAAEAPDLELGFVGLLPLYHPVEAAEQLSTLDVICGGKLVLAPPWAGAISSSRGSASPSRNG